MKTDSNETNVAVAWCPFVAFRIAIGQKLPDSWPAPRRMSWPSSSKRRRAVSRELKRQLASRPERNN